MDNIELQTKLEASMSDGRAKQRKIDDLRRDLLGMKKKVDFKTNLEKSFESLQLQYQAKVDQLEKIKRIGSLREALSLNYKSILVICLIPILLNQRPTFI